MEDKAFCEFISARCEEILSSDPEYAHLESRILEVQRELKKTLGEKELMLFMEFERLSVEQQTLGEYLCLKTYFEI